VVPRTRRLARERQGVRLKKAISAREIVAFAAVVIGAGAFVLAVRTRAGWDQDIWWHLATGRWIVQHGQLPATDPFSQYGLHQPWIAYSWLFELIAYGAYAALGLEGIVLLCAALGSLIAGGLYLLVRRLGAPLLPTLVLVLAAFYAIMPLTTPRPWLFSLLFFLVELHVIVDAQHGRTRTLWLLPLLFVVWANIHIQFAIGLVVLAAGAVDAYWNNHQRDVLVRWISVGLASGLATLVTPFHVRLYLVAREYMGQSELWERIGEFVAPTFRTSPDWVILALVLAAAGCLGWQARDRSMGVFWLLLFVLGVWLGFRSRRDTWVVVATATCVIATVQPRATEQGRDAMSVPEWLGSIVAVALALFFLILGVPRFSSKQLEANVARNYPVKAAEFIDNQNAAGPLYNYFDWGGYLIWRLPRLPVSMDGRTPVHGVARILRQADTWHGAPNWRDDAELMNARLIVGPSDVPLASLLRLDQRFRLVYEDRDGPAVVFEAK